MDLVVRRHVEVRSIHQRFSNESLSTTQKLFKLFIYFIFGGLHRYERRETKRKCLLENSLIKEVLGQLLNSGRKDLKYMMEMSNYNHYPITVVVTFFFFQNTAAIQ